MASGEASPGGASDPASDLIWLVSTATRYRQVGTSADHDRPVGMQHARRLGDRQTACGVAAVNWHLFIGRSFAPGVDTCAGCVRAVAATERRRVDGWG